MRINLLAFIVLLCFSAGCRPGDNNGKSAEGMSDSDSAKLSGYLDRGRSMTDYNEGLSLAQMLRDHANADRNVDDEISSLHVLFELHFNNGNNSMALNAVQRAVDLGEQTQNQYLKARSFHFMGRYLVRMRNSTVASRNLSTAFRTYWQLGDTLSFTAVFRDLVRSYNQSAMFDSSVVSLRRCFMLDSILNNSTGIAENFAYWGSTFIEKFKVDLVNPRLDLLDSAQACFDKAQVLESELGSRNLYIEELLSMGYSDIYCYRVIYQELSQLQKAEYINLALGYLNTAQKYVRISHDAKNREHYDLAGLQLRIIKGDSNGWKSYADSLVELSNAENAGYEEKEIACWAMALVSNYQGDYQKETQYLKQALLYDNASESQNNSLAVSMGIVKGQYEGEQARNKARQMQMEGEARALRGRLVSMTLFALVLVVFGIYIFRSLRKEKRLIAQVNEYNAELMAANDEIMSQSVAISESIEYATLIQQAAMPSADNLKEIFGDCLAFFRPKDNVSGDFFWAMETGPYKLLVAGDCTGHGVPGAMLSMLGMSVLEYCTRHFGEDGNISAGKVLDRARTYFKRTLNQTSFRDNERVDSMDLALLIVDTNSRQLHYSGAFRPLVYFRDGRLTKIKADSMPIGVYLKEKEHFTDHVVDLMPGDVFYVFSDGVTDQQGYESSESTMSRIYSNRRFMDLLSEIYTLPFSDQETKINEAIDNWRVGKSGSQRDCEQTDDNIVLAISADNFLKF